MLDGGHWGLPGDPREAECTSPEEELAYQAVLQGQILQAVECCWLWLRAALEGLTALPGDYQKVPLEQPLLAEARKGVEG